MVRRRKEDPFRNKSEMTAKAVLVRSKATRIDSLADICLLAGVDDRVETQLMQVKLKANEIIDLIEDDER